MKTRRQALQIVAGVIGFTYGSPIVTTNYNVAGAQQAPARQSGMTLNLDGLDGIVLSYRGQKAIITPAELMAALSQK